MVIEKLLPSSEDNNWTLGSSLVLDFENILTKKIIEVLKTAAAPKVTFLVKILLSEMVYCKPQGKGAKKKPKKTLIKVSYEPARDKTKYLPLVIGIDAMYLQEENISALSATKLCVY